MCFPFFTVTLQNDQINQLWDFWILASNGKYKTTDAVSFFLNWQKVCDFLKCVIRKKYYDY